MPIECLKFFKKSVGKDTEELKLSHTADGERNNLEKSLVISYEVKYTFPFATQQ